MAKLKWLIVVLLVFGAAWGIYRFVFQPQQTAEVAGIFVITPLEYGDSTLSGLIMSDTSENTTRYFLVTEGELPRNILLSVDNIESLVNSYVTVSGYLYPPDDTLAVPYMEVSEITSQVQ